MTTEGRTEIPASYSRHPLAWCSVMFALGIATAAYFAVDLKLLLALTVVFVSVAVWLRTSSFAAGFIATAFIFAGAFSYQFEVASVKSDRIKVIYDSGQIVSSNPVEVEGTIQGRPEQAMNGAFIRLTAAKLRHAQAERTASGIVRLFVPLENNDQITDFGNLDLKSGTQIRVACELVREDQFLNPGIRSRKQLLDQQGIDAVGTVKSPLLIERFGESGFLTVFDLVLGWRSWLIEEFTGRFNHATSGVMIASLLGDKHFLDKDTAEVFRDGGTFHVLVISGLHITFIGGLLLWLCGKLTRSRKIQLLVVAGTLWLYAVAVGLEVPVVRACVMFTTFLVSRAIYRNGNLLNTLGLSCLILLALRPSDLFTPSFQLTIVSVAAIVAMAFPLIEKLHKIGEWMPDASSPFPPNVPAWLKHFCEMLYWRELIWEIERERQIWSARIFKSPAFGSHVSGAFQTISAYLFEGLLISFVVQIWMLPLTIYYFHRVTPVSIFLNLWVGLLIAIESFAAIFTVMFGLVSNSLAYPFAVIADVLNWLLVSVPDLFTDLGWASFRVPIYSGPVKPIYIFYFIPVVFTAYVLYKWDPFDLRNSTTIGRRLWLQVGSGAVVVLLLVGVMTFHPYSSPKPDGMLHVDFLDVGQGDSSLITFPNGETMLIDGGGRVTYRNDDEDEESIEPDVPRVGEMVVSEVLWEKGYSHIDYLVASHADADHAQGLADVVKNFSVGAVYIGAWPSGESELDELLAAASEHSVTIKQIGRGDRFEIEGVRIETLWPIKGKELSGSDNNSSIVLRMIYGDRSFLFTGDVEREAETAMIAGGTLLNADVVKVPHHGSRTSSIGEFVARTGSIIAIISVGKRSRFGHPHPEIVERWKNSGASVMTTGEKGMVTFRTDGHKLEYETFVK